MEKGTVLFSIFILECFEKIKIDESDFRQKKEPRRARQQCRPRLRGWVSFGKAGKSDSQDLSRANLLVEVSALGFETKFEQHLFHGIGILRGLDDVIGNVGCREIRIDLDGFESIVGFTLYPEFAQKLVEFDFVRGNMFGLDTAQQVFCQLLLEAIETFLCKSYCFVLSNNFFIFHCNLEHFFDGCCCCEAFEQSGVVGCGGGVRDVFHSHSKKTLSLTRH